MTSIDLNAIVTNALMILCVLLIDPTTKGRVVVLVRVFD